jgi:hypothetical protein
MKKYTLFFLYLVSRFFIYKIYIKTEKKNRNFFWENIDKNLYYFIDLLIKRIFII